MSDRVIDCRSEVGITIGLLDSLISIARVAAKRPLDDEDVRQALRDIATDEDIAFILNQARISHEP